MRDEDTLAFDSAVLMLEVNPLGLTNDAIDVLHAASPELAGQAIDARRRAQLATLPLSARPLETTAFVEHARTSGRAAARPRFLTRQEFRGWQKANTDAIADGVCELVKRALAKERARVDAEHRELEARVQALEHSLSIERRLRALERATGVMAHAADDVQ